MRVTVRVPINPPQKVRMYDLSKDCFEDVVVVNHVVTLFTADEPNLPDVAGKVELPGQGDEPTLWAIHGYDLEVR